MAPVSFPDLLERCRKNRFLIMAAIVTVMVLAAVGVAAAMDGDAGNQAAPMSSPVTEPDYVPGPPVSADETDLMARVIEAEAGTEPYEGRVAVGAVIMNRVAHKDFPNSVKEVVFQPRAFCVVDKGMLNRTPSEESVRAARAAVNGEDPTNGALYFWNPNKNVNNWVSTRVTLMTIGNHMFGR